MNSYDYKKICPFKWFVLQNFPFIEADFDAITNYQLLCKVDEYLNKVINNVNDIGEQTENLTNGFISLQNYVNNYFDNLDVQEEINNKLDEMVEDGTLENIIESYLNSKAFYGYNNVAEMLQATNLINGSYAKTLGYYTKNDGGGATYKITNDENLNVDNLFVLELDSGLKAQLIIENDTLNPLQFGAKNDNSVDLTSLFNSLIQSNYNTIFLPNGQYKIEGVVYLKNNLLIRGNGTTAQINIQNTGQIKTDASDSYRNINLYNVTIRVNGERSNYAIEFNNSDLCKIERCMIRSDNGISNYNGVCFRLNGGQHCYDNKIINNQFQKASLHFINSTDNFILDNMLWADNMTNAGGLVLEGNCSNTLISGNHFGGHPTLGQLRIVSINSQLRIVGNYFDALGIGMNIADIIESTISDNIFFHVQQAMLITNMKLCSITNNTFKDCDYNDEGYADINITGTQGGNTFIGNKHYRTSDVTHTNKNVPMIIPEGNTNWPHTVIDMAMVWYMNYYNAIDTTATTRNHYVNCYPSSLFTT